MTGIPMIKGSSRIDSVEAWFRLAPPKRGARQWKDTRSAKELARAWLPDPGRARVPCELLELLESHADLSGIALQHGTPEQPLRLDDFRGETRNADLVLYGRADAGTALITVEAKADESFGDLVERRLAKVSKPHSRVPERVSRIARLLFGCTREDNGDCEFLGSLRYQLLHAAAGTIIEAHRMGSSLAVMVVHEFLSPGLSRSALRRNAEDLRRFLGHMMGDMDLRFTCGVLQGPVPIRGLPAEWDALRFYIGKVERELEQRVPN